MRRVWLEPAGDLLARALGTLPLAPLGAVAHNELPGLPRAMDERFTQEAPAAEAEADRLQIVTYPLMGLHYPRDLTSQLLPGIRNMRDSVTYQAILDEGRVEGQARGEVLGRTEGERRLLLLIGAARLGEPDAATRARIEAISNIETLERLAGRVLTVSSWSELLASAE